MRKYLLIGLFTVVSYTPLLSANDTNLGGGNTCAPHSIKCPDGSTVVSYACGSLQQAQQASCPQQTPGTSTSTTGSSHAHQSPKS